MSISWLDDFRQQAKSKFEQTGFPSNRLEDWRYTNVSAIAKKEFPLATMASSPIFEGSKGGSAFHFVLVDGFFNAELSNLPKTITVCSINDAIKNHADLLQSKFNQAITQTHGFIDFNTANFTDGLFIHIAENGVLDKPLQIIHVATQAAILPTRHVVILEKNAKIHVIGDNLNINKVKNHGYITNKHTNFLLSRSKFTINSQENFYTLFLIEALSNKVKILTDHKYKNFINQSNNKIFMDIEKKNIKNLVSNNKYFSLLYKNLKQNSITNKELRNYFISS